MFYQTIRRIFVICLYLSISLFLNAQNEHRDLSASLDSILGHYDDDKKPGASIAIIENDKPIVLKSYGNANLEYQIKNTPNTLFNAGDLAKQFTVFSIMILEDQGKLSRNDNIKNYVPHLKDWPFDISIKHLMEQTSGLRDVMELKKWCGYQNGDVITKEDALETIGKQRTLNFISGSKLEYNRTGYFLLTEVIANVSGISFSQFVDQHIFTPLDMKDSMFPNDHTELIQNRSYGYGKLENSYVKISNNNSLIGGTNLYTSASDFAKWLKNLSNHGIGKPSFYSYMQTNIELPNGEILDYTPGIYRDIREGYETIHFEGSDHGYESYMINIPAYDFSFVYLSNDNNFSGDDVYEAIFSWLKSVHSKPPIENQASQVVHFLTKPNATLQNYTGNYFFEDNFGIRKVVLENDTLFYVRNENNRTPIVPIEGKHTFKMIVHGNDNYRVTFSNQNKLMEFRAFNPGKKNDYVTIARRIEPIEEEQTSINSYYKNEELGHYIDIQVKDEKILLTMDGTMITLDPIGVDEYLASSDHHLKHMKLRRNRLQKIVGVDLSGLTIRNLYYKLLCK